MPRSLAPALVLVLILTLGVSLVLPACGGGAPASKFQFPDAYSRSADDLAESDGIETVEDVRAEDGACAPECTDRDCGDDGCGGSCGECEHGQLCLSKGASAICVDQGGCPPGELLCQDDMVLHCDDDGGQYKVIEDCDALGQFCVDGECTGCQPDCAGKECGDDGCDSGTSCGSCGPSMACHEGQCLMSCDHPQCGLSEWCIDAAGYLALCGGMIDFDHDLSGQDLGHGVDVEEMFGVGGVLISTDKQDSTAKTNSYEVNSQSKGNSCASTDQWEQPWLDDLIVQFVVPSEGGLVQGSTHNVSLYIAETWPEGIRVDFHTPDDPPGGPGSAPFHQAWTEESGTAFIQHISPTPIGYLVIRKESDGDFTIDDLGFGSIRP